MVELVNVSKSYGNNIVLKKVNLSLIHNGIYLLNSESGSGKTTLLDVISKRKKCDLGTINVSDSVFYLTSDDYLIKEFTVRENIEFYKDLFIDFKEYKNRFNIDFLLDKKVSKLSKGEKQKVGIFIALSSGCKIILLDEPFSGVDEGSRRVITKELKKVSNKKIVIIASHQNIDINTLEVITFFEGEINYIQGDCIVDDGNKVRNLNRVNYWVKKMHKKQICARVLFLITSLFISFSVSFCLNKFNVLKEDFNTAFINYDIYYKENDRTLNKNNFYSNVIKNLAYEVSDYYYSFYHEKMDGSLVEVGGYKLYNGSIFSNLYRASGLKENELILEIDKYDYCLKRGYLNCLDEMIIDDLKGRDLSYIDENCLMEFVIKEVIISDRYCLYSSYLEEVVDKIFDVYKEGYFDYYLVIYKNKEEEFYKKINSIKILLDYRFDYLYEDDEYLYFLVSESGRSYFSFEEVSDNNLLVCSDVGISCNGFNFFNFNSLKYINKWDVEDLIKYQKIQEELGYNQVYISSSLSRYLNKKEGQYLDLTFYFDDKFYSLSGVEIVKVIEDEEFVIYHNNYDFKLFEEYFNKHLRIEYVYGDNDKYKATKAMDFPLIEEARVYVDNMVFFMTVVLCFFGWLTLVVLFVVEFFKTKKYYLIFKILYFNSCSYDPLFKKYNLFYLILGLVFISNISLFIGYYLSFILFYMISIKKIKSGIFRIYN